MLIAGTIGRVHCPDEHAHGRVETAGRHRELEDELLREVWILGATGRIGSSVARLLAGQDVSVALVGRDGSRLERLATELQGKARTIVAGSFDAMLAELGRGSPAVVLNTIGPFAQTALAVIGAADDAHYLDLSNELTAALDTLALDGEAKRRNRTLVTGAGWGVLGTEAVVLKLCEGEVPASSVRVDNQAAIDEAGPLGEAIGATIVDAMRSGGSCYKDGKLIPAQAWGAPLKLTAPDGHSFTSGSMPVAEMEAARRASGAPDVVSAAGAAPSAPVLRWLVFPLMVTMMKLEFVRRAAGKQFAKMPSPARANEHSWARAHVEWPDGRRKEGWLRAGEGMEFTARIAATIAKRLLDGEGRPGAFTPGALFGPDLALDAGATFVLR